MPISIRKFEERDWSTIWPLLRATFEAGETYVFAGDSSEADVHRAWVELPAATNVAVAEDARIVGTYYLKANQPGRGAHVCNCGYVVDPVAQGKGIAAAMCEHSQQLALELGFRAMQFNLVVSTNVRAVRLWQRLGFTVVGTLPDAYDHRRFGYVDALIMYKTLSGCVPGDR